MDTSRYDGYKIFWYSFNPSTHFIAMKFRYAGNDASSGYYGAGSRAGFSTALTTADQLNNATYCVVQGSVTNGNMWSEITMSPIIDQTQMRCVSYSASNAAISVHGYNTGVPGQSPDGITIYTSNGTNWSNGYVEVYGIRR
jgi:hypothetical protein